MIPFTFHKNFDFLMVIECSNVCGFGLWIPIGTYYYMHLHLYRLLIYNLLVCYRGPRLSVVSLPAVSVTCNPQAEDPPSNESSGQS